VEIMEREGSEPNFNTALHLSRHRKRIYEKERFRFEERSRNWVRRYDTTGRWGSHAIASIHDIVDRASDTKKLGKIVYVHCMIRYDGNEMSICSGVCQIYTPHHSFHLLYACISVHLPSLLKDVLGGCDRVSLEIRLEAVFVRV